MNDEPYIWHTDKHRSLPQVDTIILLCKTRHAQSIQNDKLAYLQRKAWDMKLIFCLQINTKIFYKLKVSLWVCIARHARSTENNKFTKSLQYLKENVKDEADFCLLSKVSSKWYYHFRCVWPGTPKLPKIKSLLFFCNILRKKWLTKSIFCMQVSIKTYYNLILWFWWGWSSISKVTKIASLQCLHNISK